MQIVNGDAPETFAHIGKNKYAHASYGVVHVPHARRSKATCSSQPLPPAAAVSMQDNSHAAAVFQQPPQQLSGSANGGAMPPVLAPAQKPAGAVQVQPGAQGAWMQPAPTGSQLEPSEAA